ncbi:MAG: SMP-30/gluconolactonase/LRE family protein [Methylocystis sp.]|uniref:SMP-30/gluconolactonase/LRE family protein n=1 Tax=Methylocystis sp. TaxID=1911079 RepID=UPI003DA4BDA3
MREGSSDVEVAIPAHAATGESPTWCAREEALYWIDIEEPALHRFRPSTGVDESWETPSEIGAFALCESGAVIVALRTGLAKLQPDAGVFEPLCAPPFNPLRHRFNDGKCDALGRFWVGTMYEPLRGQSTATTEARPLGFYRQEAAFQKQGADAVIPNGLAWSPDTRTMYFSDSHARSIWAFDYDVHSAALSGQRLFARFDEADGAPDGASVDEEGFYWCALYGGGRVFRLAPDGRIDREVRLPVSQPTMCAFGDADHATLYITSAAHGVDETDAGAVFRCRPGVRGLPPALFADG